MTCKYNLSSTSKNISSGLSLLILSAGISTISDATPLFTNVAADAGIATEVYRGKTIHALGINWIDYDEDGWPDLFLVNGKNEAAHLYHNNQDGSFTLVDELLPELPEVEMSGSTFADYDNDGDSDIYIRATHEVLNLQDINDLSGPPNMLLKNMYVENGNKVVAGEPLFVDVATSAGVDGVLDIPVGSYPARSSMSGGWLDYDRDGCVDLYVGQMVLQAAGDPANFNTLYKNNCDGTFTDVSATSGDVGSLDSNDLRPSLMFLAGHLDDDLDPDMYVVNVHEVSPHHLDLIYKNNADGTFTEISSLSPGMGDDSGSGMGIDISDIDLDGDWDIYLSDVYNSVNDALPLGNTLYINNGDGTWADNSAVEAGVDGRFSWGVEFFDIENNGYEDLYVTSENNDLLYVNNMDGTFTDVADAAGIDQQQFGRGSIAADYDGDGDLDMAIVYQGFNIALLRNDSTDLGNWMQLKLEGTQSNRDAIGALVKITANNTTYMRQVLSASSAHSQAPLDLHFGLGDATVASEIRVLWPSGIEDVYNNIATNARLTLIEGETIIPLAVTGVTPSVAVRNKVTELIINGQGFDPGFSCRLISSSDIRVIGTRYIDSESLRMLIAPNDAVAPGFRSLSCSNSDGEQARLRNAIEII